MEFLVETDTKNVEKFMRELPPRCRAAMADGMDHATRSFFSKFYKERLQGSPGISHTHGGIFHRFRRTVMVNGKMVFLRQQARQSEAVSIIAKSSKDPMNMSVDMYTQSDVAGMHERGGTISSAKAMPIPLNQQARDMLKSKISLDHLKVMKINGKVFLGKKRKLGGPQILFMLTHRVHIKPRLGFYSTWDAHSSRREEIMAEALNTALGKV
jgi:hypothetical protein